MPIEPGSRLGPYEVLSSIGKGGMGEVWRARDTKLDRTVAIKTLPEAFASDPERVARFEREAKLLASLNHPNIGGIYGLEEAPAESGQSPPDSAKQARALALVLELVEGETLADRLQRGPLPVDDALALAAQVAAALEAAHEKGVVHRDLKPGNVMIAGGTDTPAGTVKVLDFGLAKAFEGESGSDPSLTNSPTLSMAATQQGVILGTAGYMSPEQASGSASDKRADIWAFGVVLFEMLAGQPVFGGETVSHTLAAVLAKDPDWSLLPERLHPRLRELLERCLQKKPAERYRDIGDVRADLERVRADPAGVVVSPAAPTMPPVGLQSALPWVAAASAVCLLLAGLVGWGLWPSPEPGPVLRFPLPLPDGHNLTSPLRTVAVSPAGTRIAYANGQQLFVWDLRESEPRLVAETEADALGISQPVFSPDGEWLAYVSIRTLANLVLRRVPVTGGSPNTLLESGVMLGLSWPAPDTLLFASSDGIVRLPATGGVPEVLVAAGEDEAFDSPQVLPGGEQVLFTRRSGSRLVILGAGGFQSDSQTVVQRIGAPSDDRTVLVEGGGDAQYLPSGHLLYAIGATLFAAPFDPESRSVLGGAVPIVEGIQRSINGSSATANYGVSEDGALIWVPGSAAPAGEIPRRTVVWVDRDGGEVSLPVRADFYDTARVSPDGTKIALVVGAALQRDVLPPSIWIYDLGTENLSQLTAHPAGDDAPVWAPDSRRVFFRSFRDGPPAGVYVVDVESGEVDLVGASPDFPFPGPASISPDGSTLTLNSGQTLANIDAATLDVASGAFTWTLQGPAYELETSLSPDGAWMAFIEGDIVAGRPTVNIRPFPNVTRTLVPLGPAHAPVFSRDGTELFYFDYESAGLVAAPIELTPTLRVGEPAPLFGGAGRYLYTPRSWDPDPTGQRFLMIKPPAPVADDDGTPVRPQINVVLNWIEELKERVPVP